MLAVSALALAVCYVCVKDIYVCVLPLAVLNWLSVPFYFVLSSCRPIFVRNSLCRPICVLIAPATTLCGKDVGRY